MAEAEKKNGFFGMTDEEVVLSAQKSDRDALEEIFARYRKFIYAKVKTYFLAGAERDDIIQEGMIGLYKAVCGFNPEKYTSFMTFAGICISRRIITAVKSAARQKHMPLNSYVSLSKQVYDDESDESLADIIPEQYPQDPEAIIIDKEALDGIGCIINGALSKLELQVLVYYLEGRKYQEISELINRDIKSVDNAIQRIKKKLEAVLKKTN